MKRFLFIIIYLCFFSSNVYAQNINNITKIEYKWYKEEIDDLYYPSQYTLDGYTEDKNKIEYGEYSDWKTDFCNYSQNDYLIEEKKLKTFEKIINAKYISFDLDEQYQCNNCGYFKQIKVYSNTTLIDYEVLKDDTTGVKISLPTWYEIDTLWLNVDANTKYNITIANDQEMNIKLLKYEPADYRQKVLVPDSSWIISTSEYSKRIGQDNIISSPFIKNVTEENMCRYREKKTYRYKITRTYYDDKYHEYIENYIPDINDYIINYKDEKYTNTKIIEIPKVEKEYVYIEAPIEQSKENDSQEQLNETNNDVKEKTIYQTKYIDKIITKVPKKVYIIFIILILIIIILTIKIMIKKVE